MKELVNEIIADAIQKGFVTTRCKPGRKRDQSLWLLDPLVCEHTIEYSDSQQRCRLKGCNERIHTFCPGCAKDENHCSPASGFYCFNKNRNCLAIHHRNRARTRAPDDAEADS